MKLGAGKARLLGATLLFLAVWESGTSISLSQARVQKEDIQAMQRALAGVQSPVLAHRRWMDPNLRSWFAQAAKPLAFANPEPNALTEFWTVGHVTDPEPLAFGSRARLQQSVIHGSLVARRWTQNEAKIRLATLGVSPDEILDLKAKVEQGYCQIKTRSPLRIQCPDQSSLRWETSEIDYLPRACLAYRGSQLGQLTLSFRLAHPEKLASIQGHVGFSDFNARLRSDAALALRLQSEEHELLNHPFTDAQGWAPFSAALSQEMDASDRFHLTLQLNANQARSERLRRPVIPCIDLGFQSLTP